MTIRKLKNLIPRNPINFIIARLDWPDWKTTPPEVADKMKDIIQDKVVCDLGCRKGYFMLALQKYAKKVVGVEKEKHFVKMCWKKGLDVVQGDYLKDSLPPADVYYMWSKDREIKDVLRARNQRAKLVIGSGEKKNREVEIIDI